jgi:hypothetical protein
MKLEGLDNRNINTRPQDTTDGHNSFPNTIAPTPSSSDDDKYTYTAIIHKSNIRTLHHTKAGPSFEDYNHTDHYRIVFKISHSKNTTRTTDCTATFLTATFAGDELHTTVRVPCISKFIWYLICKGMGSFLAFGRGILRRSIDLLKKKLR